MTSEKERRQEEEEPISCSELAGKISWGEYSVNWDRIHSLHDLKRILKKMDIKFYNMDIGDIKDLLSMERKD